VQYAALETTVQTIRPLSEPCAGHFGSNGKAIETEAKKAGIN